MPITYTDKKLENLDNFHPALLLDPDFKIVRYGDKGRSVFTWNIEEAIEMYEWYVIKYSDMIIVDEFGDTISSYDFRQIITESYYSIDLHPSKLTISEEYEKRNPKENTGM